jgi:hypothetical protein
MPERILKGICWHLNQSLQNVRVFDRDADAFFKDVHELNQYMDTVFLKRYLYTRIYIIVNIGRAIYSDKQELLEIPIPTTPRKILEAISTVYQRSVTEDYVNTLVEVDGGHCEENSEALQMLKDGGDVRCHHLQGGLLFFEGLKLVNCDSGNTYELRIGS